MNTKQIAIWIMVVGCIATFFIIFIVLDVEKQRLIEELTINKQVLQQQLNDANKEKVVEVPVKQGCDLLDDLGKRDICLRNEPYANWDCTKFSDFSFTIECYQTLAIEERKPEYCVKLKNDYDRDNCYRGVANAMNKPEICMGIIFPDIRLSCYQKINLKGVSPDVCNSGWTLDERHQCRELILEANE